MVSTGTFHALDRAMRHYLWLALVFGTGCVGFGDTAASIEGEDEGGDTDTEGDRDDCKIEGDAIGQDGATILLAAKTLTFGSWIPKSDSPGEYVGFSVTVSNGSTLDYVVKAGGELHPSTATTWLHPAGPDGGSQAPGISNVDACDPEQPPGDQDPPPDDEPPPPPPPGDDGPIL